jgi:hypothetical protein
MELPLDKVRKVLKIAKEPISLETPIGEEEDSHLGDFIEDKNAVNPAEAVINMNLSDQTRRVLKTLTPREEKASPRSPRSRAAWPASSAAPRAPRTGKRIWTAAWASSRRARPLSPGSSSPTRA